MKTKTKITRQQLATTFILIAFAAVLAFQLSSCGDDRCDELKTENLFFEPIEYKGNETFKYLHNNIDTHTFQFYNKQTYYTTPETGGNEGDCPTQYQGQKINLLNKTTGSEFLLQFERDRNLFPRKPDPGAVGIEYTYFKFSGPNCFYYKQMSYSGMDSLIILGKKYPFVRKIGGDSIDNYINYGGGNGILTLKINGEKWDLIP